jgi:hypothetical protein
MLKFSRRALPMILFIMFNYVYGQPIIIPKFLRLPSDSVQNKNLISSLNGLLTQALQPNKDNSFIDSDYLPETSLLLDEIKGMENAGPDKNNFYKCYLSDITPIDSNERIVQFSYLGTDETTPLLRASFKLIAKRTGDKYLFYSPLQRNTLKWTKKKEGKFVFYFKTELNTTLANNYAKKAAEFDKKLNAPEYITEMYFCDNVQEAIELLGVTYKADYSGFSHDNFASLENNKCVFVFGMSGMDPEALNIHDCWHERFHNAVGDISTINRPVDEGCAYLYGGSWGYSWPAIFKKFLTAAGIDKDWLKHFTENKNFGENQQFHLYPAYVINALLIKKIEKEKGFSGVMELLTCGKKEPSNENYFRALNKIIGINQTNFNVSIEKLIEEETSRF